ncbi:ATP-binding protein [Fibrella sp. HMF5335]|uniref:ATP-binding protein n=1 Tax=Fibrella rubiginis TaxID=2817060 RepID=A0A939GHM6_9BACT|nr:ATP-binding protein [Fibrella rubiginis]MBO0937640.1 ATP-binding protein [Fibrella rubiginis]
MKLTKSDIGAEVISILTRGMYPDPRDAVREYIQNAVDAKAKNVSVSVRQSSVVIEDDGVGMNYDTLRKALRMGISDKRPGKDVGFMGIGIYSAFHLCDTLTIYTKTADTSPQSVRMNFASMRSTLNVQRDKRLNGEIDGDQLTDLQTLLENNITLQDEYSLMENEYPVLHGTRVELVGLDPILDDSLNNFDLLSNYLRDVVPLRFDRDQFTWGGLIEDTINESCDNNGAHFELVNLKLGVSGRSADLFRPYLNSDFSNSAPQKPFFKSIKKGGILLGVAWGCLNSTKERISKKELRGFLLKKQGFSVGKRESLARLFGSSNTHFDRYIGEIIVVSPDILPNAARNGLEVSALKTWFDEQLAKEVAPFFNGKSTAFQEKKKAEELLDELGGQLKDILVRFSPNEDNPDTLINLIAEINSTVNIKLKTDKNGKIIRVERNTDFQNLLNVSKKLEKDIRFRLEQLFNNKQHVKKPHQQKSQNQASVAEDLNQYTASETLKKFKSLTDVLDDVGIEYSDVIGKILFLINEKFVSLADNKSQQYRLLNELKEEIESLQL